MVRPYINTPTHALDLRNSRLKNEMFSTCLTVVEQKLEKSVVIDLASDTPTKIPRFDRHEIVEGKVIGRGGFAVIREITLFELDKDTARRPSGSSSRSERTAGTSATERSSIQEPRESMVKEIKDKKNKKIVSMSSRSWTDRMGCRPRTKGPT